MHKWESRETETLELLQSHIETSSSIWKYKISAFINLNIPILNGQIIHFMVKINLRKILNARQYNG